MQKQWEKLVGSGAKPKLLIIDDEPDMLDFLERVLRRRFTVSRFTVSPSNSAEAALELLSSGEYEVLITDQMMPGVSGLELVAIVAERHPRLVRLLLSGYAEVPEIQKAVEKRTIHNYILKPVDSRKLLTAIEEAYQVRDGKELKPPE